jgi:hypothetical protein
LVLGRQRAYRRRVKLKLPPTLAFPTADDLPAGTDLATADAARAAARIEPGYTIELLSAPSRFTYFARCNVDNDDLFGVFEALVAKLPEPIGTIVGPKGEEPDFLPYAARADVMRILRLYRNEIVRDPFLECGVTHQVDGKSDEVFIAAAKYLRVWGNDVAAFRRTMAGLGLEEIPDLRFVDEFPLTSQALRVVEPGALHYVDVLEELAERVRDLVPA